ncbi:MAG: hypothetical protein ACJAZ3_001052 [Sphingobacteriales bacterium]|jgi:hypothetical protein
MSIINKLKSIDKLHYLLFATLAYPLFYAIPEIVSIGYTFSLIYFISISGILALSFITFKQFKVNLSDLITIVLMLLLIGIIAFQTNDPRYSKPLLFFSFVFLVFFASSLLRKQPEKSGKTIYFFTFFYLCLTVFSYLIPGNYLNERFIGFTLSPTIFSIYLETILILYLFRSDSSTRAKILVFFLCFFFIYITKTRTNLLFLFYIPFYIVYTKHIRSPKIISFAILITIIVSFYPMYNSLREFQITKNFSGSRLESNNDASYDTRTYLTKICLDEIEQSSNVKLIFGHGSEYSRLLIEKFTGVDLFPHQDFLRFIIDFGLITFILFLIILYRLTKNSPISFLLLILYLVSFYHNYIYSFYLLSLIILFRNKKQINSLNLKLD